MNPTFRKYVSGALIFLLVHSQAYAAGTVLATSPLVTSASDSVLPNMLIGFDDSFSMDLENLPDDEADGGSSVVWKFGYFGSRSAQCNGLFYNPAVTYTVPVTSTSSNFPNADYYGAYANGFNTSTSTTNLASGFIALNYSGQSTSSTSNAKDSAGQAGYYYLYLGAQTASQKNFNVTSGTFFNECNASRGVSSNPAAAPTTAAYVGTLAAGGTGPVFRRVNVGYQITISSYAANNTSPSCTATITTAANGTLGLVVGGAVDISGLGNSNFNGSRTVASVISSTQFTYTNPICTGTISGGGTLKFAPANHTNLTFSARSATTAAPCTVTMNTGIDGTVGMVANSTVVTIAGMSNAVFNGTRTVATIPSTTQFTFTNPTSCAGTAPTTGIGAYAVAGATDERQNYANWFQYYKTRMLMMKTSMGLAFKDIGDKYRVGFLSMNATGQSNFLNVDTFATAQKSRFYTLLYSKATAGSTPGRETLANMGRYFANKLTASDIGVTSVTDPLQYSCQQNFGVFATDGFWNSTGGKKLDGTTDIGNEDGAEPRPYSDGSTVTVTADTPSTVTVRKQVDQPIKSTTDWTRYKYVVGAVNSCATQSSSGRTGGTNTNAGCLADGGQNSDGSARKWCAFAGTYSTPGVTGGTYTAPNPSSSEECTVVSASGSTTAFKVYACRHSSNSTSTPGGTGSSGCAYDGTGQAWCIFSTTATGYGCVAVETAGTDSNRYICKAQITGANDGYTVAKTPQTYRQLKTGAVTTTVTDTATTTYSRQVTVNGVANPVLPNTPTATVVASNPAGPITDTTPSAIATNPYTSAYSSDNGSPAAAATPTEPDGTTVNSCVASLATITPAASPGPLAASTTQYSAYVAGTEQVANNGLSTSTTMSTSPAVVGTTITSGGGAGTTTSGGTTGTMADVAEYYYVTDLRTSALGNCTGTPVSPATTGGDVCTNDVPVSGNDAASWQHMTTFTLALGARGVMLYSPTYLTDTSGDYYSVKTGATATSTVCTWQTAGTICNWPVPSTGAPSVGITENIDDTWHAAVNGRGQYFSATDPTTLSYGLKTALAGVQTRSGSSAAATTSNPNVTSGDNFVFSSTFTTQEWDGQLVRQQLDLVSGAVSSTIDWTAQTQLDSLSPRNIYTRNPDNATTTLTGLMSFTYANLTSTDQAYFQTANISSLSQFCGTATTCLSGTSQSAAAETNLVNYLRGDRTNEGTSAQQGTLSVSTPQDKYYRQRVHLLGDIVNAEAVYVKTPLLSYSDTGFTTYSTTGTVASRQGMVYVAANDGMLHGFNSSTGAEVFTYVPTYVFPTLYKLADKNYGTTVGQPHQYFVDGTPVSGDIYYNGAWRTIVVAGLNGGGKGYYALDVTDPTNPKSLWEFTDTNMGYAYGNPIITKLKDCNKTTSITAAATCTNPADQTGSGTWVVMFTSGYNNDLSGQDGKGHLYIVNAGSGALIRDISTGAGDTTTPSGLAKINAWVDNTATDNTAVRVYGGDLLGNVWRFDINNLYDTSGGGYKAQKLITVYADAAGTTPQPITTKPEIGEVNSTAVVYVGTGRYLASGDLTDATLQSFYAIKDDLGTTTHPNPRGTSGLSTTASESVADATAKFVKQDLTITTCPANSPATICSTGQIVRTSTAKKVSFPTNNGWFIDLPDSRERANTDPTLALGTLGFTTNVPTTSACTAGGTSFRYLVDYTTGGPLSTSTTKVSGIQLGSALATRAVFVRLPNNTVVQLTRMSDGTTLTTNVPIGASGSTAKRISWRELISDQ